MTAAPLYATFVTGLQDVVAQVLKASGASVNEMLDGAVEFSQGGKIIPPCFHNTFEVILRVKCRTGRPLDFLLQKILSSKDGALAGRLAFQGKPRYPAFRVMTSVENQPAAIDKTLRLKLETLIERHTGLPVNRGGGVYEYWLLSRSEGTVYFMKRLTYSEAEEKPSKGALRPQLAYLLNVIAGPKPEDVLLDPFCGCGSIPLERVRHFPAAKVCAFDIDAAMADFTRERLARYSRPNVWTGCADVSDLPGKIEPGTVTKIITDPPWGLYKPEDTRGLYQKMLKVFLRLLARGGTMVLLTAQKALLPALLSGAEYTDAFRLRGEYGILVNGKKASVFVADRL